MIKYIGSKRLLLPQITTCVAALPGVRRVLDLFSGTSRVGHALKGAGYEVIANDHNTYAHVLARCYVQADADRWREPARDLIVELNALAPCAGYFTRTFCEEARFLHPRNGARVDAIRAELAARDLPPDLMAIVLTSLIEAADRVDSTTGVQMAYLKQWAPRALRDMALRVPAILAGPGQALCLDAARAAACPVDLVYLDPPYNQHSYRGNYHVWETLARGDEPACYGVARKRLDCRTFKSAFNSKRNVRAALDAVLAAVRARYILLSFNDEGYVSREEMETLLRAHGRVAVFATEYARYVGARIGIHNPSGKRVGTVGALRCKEFLFVVAPEQDELDAVEAALLQLKAGRATPDPLLFAC